MGTPIDPPLQGPVLRTIELTQKAPECFTNDGGTEPVVNLARDQCNQTLKRECPLILPQIQYGAASIKAFSSFVGQMLTYVYQSIGWVSAP